MKLLLAILAAIIVAVLIFYKYVGDNTLSWRRTPVAVLTNGYAKVHFVFPRFETCDFVIGTATNEADEIACPRKLDHW